MCFIPRPTEQLTYCILKHQLYKTKHSKKSRAREVMNNLTIVLSCHTVALYFWCLDNVGS